MVVFEKLEAFLDWGGTKKDIVFVVLSGLAMIAALIGVPTPIDPSWLAIILCGVPIILGAIIGLVDPTHGGAISLEPGGQFELSGAPLAHLHQTAAELHAHMAQVRELAEPLHAAGKTVHVIGGCDVAMELDARRAIAQGTRLALGI